MSNRLLQQSLNVAGNLLLFQTEIGTIISVSLIYCVLSNCSVFLRSTYCLDNPYYSANLMPNDNLLEIIDLVNKLLALSGCLWLLKTY